MTGTLVFVYGSLRKGGWNEHFLAEAEYAGEGVTAGRCALYICPQSGLPYLTLDPVSRVAGELYRVSDEVLTRIDYLEGEPDSYMRMPLDVEAQDGQIVEAQVYVWLHSTADLELAPCGNWLDTIADFTDQ